MLWINALHKTLKSGQACVLVTITGVSGSAPRRVGARMLVTLDSIADTIGGGTLEQDAIDRARSMLNDAPEKQTIESRTAKLGPDLTQCCGGSVTISYEYHPACALNIVVFGAGHVAQCVATLLTELPCRALFYDSRPEWLSKLPTGSNTRGCIESAHLGANAFGEIEQCPDNAYYLVMTHSHELDFDVVEGVLSRGDSTYCGLIASKSKAASFRSRLSRKGFTQHEIEKLTAPIGEQLGGDNLPMEVAIAALSEMLSVRNNQASAHSLKRLPKADIT